MLLASFQEKSLQLGQALEDRFDSVAQELKEEHGEVLEAFRGTIDRVNAIVGAQDETEISLVEQVRQLSAYADTLDEVLNEHRGLNQELQTNIGGLISQQSAVIQSQLGLQAKNLEDFHDKISSVVQDYGKAQEKSAEANFEFAERLGAALERGYSDLKEQISRVSTVATTGLEAYQQVLADLERTETGLIAGTKGLSDRIDTFAEQISGQWIQMVEATTLLQQHVTESGTALSSLSRRLQEQLDVFRAELKEEQEINRTNRTAENESHLALMLEITSSFSQEVETQSKGAIQALSTLITESGTALSSVGRRLEDQLRLFREQLLLDQSGNREILSEDREGHLGRLVEVSESFSAEVERQQGEIRRSIESVIPALETGFTNLNGSTEKFALELSRLEASLTPARQSIGSLESSANALVTQLKELRERAGLPSEVSPDTRPALPAIPPKDQMPAARGILRRWIGGFGNGN